MVIRYPDISELIYNKIQNRDPFTAIEIKQKLSKQEKDFSYYQVEKELELLYSNYLNEIYEASDILLTLNNNKELVKQILYHPIEVFKEDYFLSVSTFDFYDTKYRKTEELEQKFEKFLETANRAPSPIKLNPIETDYDDIVKELESESESVEVEDVNPIVFEDKPIITLIEPPPVKNLEPESSETQPEDIQDAKKESFKFKCYIKDVQTFDLLVQKKSFIEIRQARLKAAGLENKKFKCNCLNEKIVLFVDDNGHLEQRSKKNLIKINKTYLTMAKLLHYNVLSVRIENGVITITKKG